MRKFSSLDSETPEGKIALICTPTESYNVETWEEFTSRFMVAKNLKTIFFTWNLRFDAQAILKLLPYDKLIELWKAKKHNIKYKGYRVTYIPKKLLSVTKIEGKNGGITLYDASQYYGNKSLDSQAKEYLNEGKLGTVSAKEIGKSRAYYDGNVNKIIRYCKRDAELTLRLARLSMKNIKMLGFNPSNPISPASISRKYQRKRGFPASLKKASNMERKANGMGYLAYKGGVFATYQRGLFNQPLYDYDVNSCYPNIMVELPDWRDGEFEFIEGDEPEKYEYGWVLVEVDSEYLPHQEGEHYTVTEIYEDVGSWDVKYTAKKVTYPTGLRIMVITTDEYRWLKEEGEKITYLGKGMGWVRKTHNYPNPFAWMKEMYKKRKGFKKTDPALAQTMKLLMNSLYGSTVQRKNGIGDLSNFCYGSYITGRARKQMFVVVKANKPYIVNVATDGLLSTKKLGGENYGNKRERKMEDGKEEKKRMGCTPLHFEPRGKGNYENVEKRTWSNTRDNQQNDQRDEYTERDNIRTVEENTTGKFIVGDNLGEWEYTEYSKGLIIGNGIRQLWKKDGSFETHARGITSDRKYDLLLNLLRCFHSRLPVFPVGRVRVIQLGTMINAHIKWKKEHLNTFVMQSRVLNANTDKKREWEREYKDFADLLTSPTMRGEALKI